MTIRELVKAAETNGDLSSAQSIKIVYALVDCAEHLERLTGANGHEESCRTWDGRECTCWTAKHLKALRAALTLPVCSCEDRMGSMSSGSCPVHGVG